MAKKSKLGGSPKGVDSFLKKRKKKSDDNKVDTKPVKSFRESFSSAKKAGKKTFTWKGKSYSTQTAEEKAVNMTDKQLEKAGEDSYDDAKVKLKTVKTDSGSYEKRLFGSKSHNEIMDSYTNERTYRIGDEVTKQGLDVTKYKDRMKAKKIKGSAFGAKRPNRLKKK